MIDNIQEENSLGHIHGFFKNKELLEGKAMGMDFIENETGKIAIGGMLCYA